MDRASDHTGPQYWTDAHGTTHSGSMGIRHIASSKPDRGGRLAATRHDTCVHARPAWMDVPLPPRPVEDVPPSGEHAPHQMDTASTLRAWTAVRPQEAAEQEVERDRPRVSVEPVHALIVVGVLVIALATSLTLLIQQSMSLAHEQSTTPTVSATASATGTEPPQSTPVPSEPTTVETTSTLVDLNTASQAQLESVKGIGPITAANIIAYRASAGRFTSVDELLNVHGIGAKTLEKIRPYVGVR